jgi:hypothetical protein
MRLNELEPMLLISLGEVVVEFVAVARENGTAGFLVGV